VIAGSVEFERAGDHSRSRYILSLLSVRVGSIVTTVSVPIDCDGSSDLEERFILPIGRSY